MTTAATGDDLRSSSLPLTTAFQRVSESSEDVRAAIEKLQLQGQPTTTTSTVTVAMVTVTTTTTTTTRNLPEVTATTSGQVAAHTNPQNSG